MLHPPTDVHWTGPPTDVACSTEGGHRLWTTRRVNKGGAYPPNGTDGATNRRTTFVRTGVAPALQCPAPCDEPTMLSRNRTNLPQWRPGLLLKGGVLGGGGGLARGRGVGLFAFGGAYWPLATAHSDPLWARTCFGCVNGAPG